MLCRLCLKDNKVVHNIITSNLKCAELTLIEALHGIFGIDVAVDDPYSKFICAPCETVVHYIGSYRTLFQRNQLILEKRLNDQYENDERLGQLEETHEITKGLRPVRKRKASIFQPALPELENNKVLDEYEKKSDVLCNHKGDVVEVDDNNKDSTSKQLSPQDNLSPTTKKRKLKFVEHHNEGPASSLSAIPDQCQNKTLETPDQELCGTDGTAKEKEQHDETLLQVHDEVGVMVCKYCSKLFTTKHILNSHIEAKHNCSKPNDKPMQIKLRQRKPNLRFTSLKKSRNKEAKSLKTDAECSSLNKTLNPARVTKQKKLLFDVGKSKATIKSINDRYRQLILKDCYISLEKSMITPEYVTDKTIVNEIQIDTNSELGRLKRQDGSRTQLTEKADQEITNTENADISMTSKILNENEQVEPLKPNERLVSKQETITESNSTTNKLSEMKKMKDHITATLCKIQQIKKNELMKRRDTNSEAGLTEMAELEKKQCNASTKGTGSPDYTETVSIQEEKKRNEKTINCTEENEIESDSHNANFELEGDTGLKSNNVDIEHTILKSAIKGKDDIIITIRLNDSYTVGDAESIEKSVRNQFKWLNLKNLHVPLERYAMPSECHTPEVIGDNTKKDCSAKLVGKEGETDCANIAKKLEDVKKWREHISATLLKVQQAQKNRLRKHEEKNMEEEKGAEERVMPKPQDGSKVILADKGVISPTPLESEAGRLKKSHQTDMKTRITPVEFEALNTMEESHQVDTNTAEDYSSTKKEKEYSENELATVTVNLGFLSRVEESLLKTLNDKYKSLRLKHFHVSIEECGMLTECFQNGIKQNEQISEAELLQKQPNIESVSKDPVCLKEVSEIQENNEGISAISTPIEDTGKIPENISLDKERNDISPHNDGGIEEECVKKRTKTNTAAHNSARTTQEPDAKAVPVENDEALTDDSSTEIPERLDDSSQESSIASEECDNAEVEDTWAENDSSAESEPENFEKDENHGIENDEGTESPKDSFDCLKNENSKGSIDDSIPPNHESTPHTTKNLKKAQLKDLYIPLERWPMPRSAKNCEVIQAEIENSEKKDERKADQNNAVNKREEMKIWRKHISETLNKLQHIRASASGNHKLKISQLQQVKEGEKTAASIGTERVTMQHFKDGDNDKMMDVNIRNDMVAETTCEGNGNNTSEHGKGRFDEETKPKPVIETCIKLEDKDKADRISEMQRRREQISATLLKIRRIKESRAMQETLQSLEVKAAPEEQTVTSKHQGNEKESGEEKKRRKKKKKADTVKDDINLNRCDALRNIKLSTSSLGGYRREISELEEVNDESSIDTTTQQVEQQQSFPENVISETTTEAEQISNNLLLTEEKEEEIKKVMHPQNISEEPPKLEQTDNPESMQSDVVKNDSKNPNPQTSNRIKKSKKKKSKSDMVAVDETNAHVEENTETTPVEETTDPYPKPAPNPEERVPPIKMMNDITGKPQERQTRNQEKPNKTHCSKILTKSGKLRKKVQSKTAVEEEEKLTREVEQLSRLLGLLRIIENKGINGITSDQLDKISRKIGDPESCNKLLVEVLQTDASNPSNDNNFTDARTDKRVDSSSKDKEVSSSNDTGETKTMETWRENLKATILKIRKLRQSEGMKKILADLKLLKEDDQKECPDNDDISACNSSVEGKSSKRLLETDENQANETEQELSSDSNGTSSPSNYLVEKTSDEEHKLSPENDDTNSLSNFSPEEISNSGLDKNENQQKRVQKPIEYCENGIQLAGVPKTLHEKDLDIINMDVNINVSHLIETEVAKENETQSVMELTDIEGRKQHEIADGVLETEDLLDDILEQLDFPMDEEDSRGREQENV